MLAPWKNSLVFVTFLNQVDNIFCINYLYNFFKIIKIIQSIKFMYKKTIL